MRAVAGWALLVVVLSGCGPREPSPAEMAERAAALLSPARQAGQLVMAPLGSNTASWAASRQIGGVWIEDARADAVVRQLASLQRTTSLPLLVGADLDYGVGHRVNGATAFPLALAVGALAGPEAAREMGEQVGKEARAVGIHLGLVRGVPTNQSTPPALLAREPTAAAGIAAYLDGLAEADVLPAVRLLYTGAASAGETMPLLQWDAERFRAVEWPALALAAEVPLAGIMLGAVVAPALTGDTLPLPFSPAAVSGLLRRDLGWQGLVLADLSPSSPLVRRYGLAAAAVRAVAAGTDLLVGVADPPAVVAALTGAVRSGTLPPERLARSARRVLEMKFRLGLHRSGGAAPDTTLPIGTPQAAALARAVAQTTLVRLGSPVGRPQTTRPPVVLATAGDSLTELATRLAELLPGLVILPLDPRADSLPTADRARLAGAGTWILADALPGNSLIDYVASALPDGARPRVVLLRLDGGDPPPSPVADEAVVAWGTAPAVQQALATSLVGAAPFATRPPANYLWPPAPRLRVVEPDAVGMSAAKLQQVDRILRDALRDSVFTGAALAVGRRGGLVRLQGYGRASDLPGAPRVTAGGTLFDIASLTKVAGTTAAVMVLVDQGRLHWNTPVQQFFPEWREKGKNRATIWNLLTHTAGLPAGAWLFGGSRSPEEALRRVIRTPLVRPPGEKVVYSDFGMILMAEIVRRVTGEPMDRFLAESVYMPLGMASTGYLPPLAERNQIVASAWASERDMLLQGVVHDANAFRLGGVAGHAGLFSTARDLAVLAQTLLNGGAYGTLRWVSPEVVQSFTRKQPGADTRAPGWDTPADRSSAGEFFSARSFGHTGFTGTSLWIDPEQDLFVVLLTNRVYTRASPGAILQVRRAVHDAVAQAITDTPVRKRPGAR